MDTTPSRKIWLDAMLDIAAPVLESLSSRRLTSSLPGEFHPERSAFAPLEAFGRLACGIAPWLESEGLTGEEEALRRKTLAQMLDALDAATDPASPDYMDFGAAGPQPLVDAAFLAHALIRAPKRLIGGLDSRVKANLTAALVQTRAVTPHPCNWLLFSAMVETALFRLGADFDKTRICYAVDMHMQWYKGDGAYGDGASFHWDYYNSFVIQPMLVDIVTAFKDDRLRVSECYPAVIGRAARYAAVLERMINPDGTFPAFGRSLTYRFGAFQMLSQAALKQFLPESVTPAQVRCGLTAVIRRVMSAETMFDEAGWLRPGLFGFQPGLAEPYISTGSLYLCAAVFLPLGLPPEDPFWAAPDEAWTSKKVWSGADLPLDHAYSEK